MGTLDGHQTIIGRFHDESDEDSMFSIFVGNDIEAHRISTQPSTSDWRNWINEILLTQHDKLDRRTLLPQWLGHMKRDSRGLSYAYPLVERHGFLVVVCACDYYEAMIAMRTLGRCGASSLDQWLGISITANIRALYQERKLTNDQSNDCNPRPSAPVFKGLPPV